MSFQILVAMLIEGASSNTNLANLVANRVSELDPFGTASMFIDARKAIVVDAASTCNKTDKIELDNDRNVHIPWINGHTFPTSCHRGKSA